MTNDPVCGMKVEPAEAFGQSHYHGHTYYFCSSHCKAKFDADPARHVETAKASGEHSCCHAQHSHTHSHQPRQGESGEPVKPSANTKYFCPMDPEVVSDNPGSCPKCGMALELNPAWKPEKKTIYTCPMHPEIEQDHPGTCPKCGMALEPKTVSAETEEDDSELRDMTRRFWIGGALTLPIFLL